MRLAFPESLIEHEKSESIPRWVFLILQIVSNALEQMDLQTTSYCTNENNSLMRTPTA